MSRGCKNHPLREFRGKLLSLLELKTPTSQSRDPVCDSRALGRYSTNGGHDCHQVLLICTMVMTSSCGDLAGCLGATV